MTQERLEEIRRDNEKVKERVKIAGAEKHVFSVQTVRADCAVIDELLEEVNRLRELNKEKP